MFQAIQIAYWLALATWFGGVLFIAIAAPIIFRVVHDADPTLPKVLSVNLQQQHSTLLAGTIVADILAVLTRIQLICAAVLFFAMLGHWFYVDRIEHNLIIPILRTALYIAATALLMWDWLVIWPKIVKYRQEYIDHADEPEIANPAKEQFDRYHQESVTILRNMLFLLLAIIVFSSNLVVPSKIIYQQ